MIYDSLQEALEKEVLPVYDRDPGRIYLDKGKNYKQGTRPGAIFFRRDGLVWRLDKDQYIDYLVAACHILQKGEDPFSLGWTEDGRPCLRASHLYVYIQSKNPKWRERLKKQIKSRQAREDKKVMKLRGRVVEIPKRANGRKKKRA